MKPNKEQLGGVRPSDLKTLMRQCGFKVPRGFYSQWYYPAKRGDRLYMITYDAGQVCMRISEPLDQFDRWANSTECFMPIRDFISELRLVKIKEKQNEC